MSNLSTSLFSERLSLMVTPERLLEKAAAAEQSVCRMQQSFDALGDCVSRTSGYWIGEAADAHRSYFTERKGEIQEMFERLNGELSNLRSMAMVYTQAEREVTAVAEDLPSDVIL